MADIFHEVEEDLRRDRLNKVWARYGSLFLTVAVLAVGATAGIVFWRQYQENQVQQAAENYDLAAQKVAAGDIDGALAAYGQIAAESHDGYAVMAEFRQAGLLAAKNDIPGALAVYDKILNSSADDRMKAIARLRVAIAVIDVESPDVLKNRVAPLIGDDSPWRFSAREIQAYADYRAKRPEAAAAYAALAADEKAPQSLRTRAGQIAAFLAGGAEVSVAAPPPAPPVPMPTVPVPGVPPVPTPGMPGVPPVPTPGITPAPAPAGTPQNP